MKLRNLEIIRNLTSPTFEVWSFIQSCHYHRSNFKEKTIKRPAEHKTTASAHLHLHDNNRYYFSEITTSKSRQDHQGRDSGNDFSFLFPFPFLKISSSIKSCFFSGTRNITVVSFPFSVIRKYPLFKKVVYFRVPEI